MKKHLIVSGFWGVFLLLTSCKTQQDSLLPPDNQTPTTYWKNIHEDSLAKNLNILASAEFEGRRTGELGQKRAANFIAEYYKRLGISHPRGTADYFQEIPASFMRNASMKLKDSENVWAYIEGTEKPDEILIISAHYDHLGILLDQIYFGADDNASGTVALMEIARIFKQIYNQGIKPKRSVLFLHVSGEEFGLFGSKYYVENPIFSLKNTIANLNIDMIGRRSKEYTKPDDYIFLVGSKKLSDDLHYLSEKANIESVNLSLDYKFDHENDPQQIYYRSDHYNFAKNNIPVIFYYNGTHEDYHLPTDTPDKIDFPLMKKRVQLIFETAWKLVNETERPKLNSKTN
ncbi:M28 family metallopeptidase [Myroides indicus]|uniref:M28 family metallopeptidase n=1 Tax=Myroides indicus TaxID=1323422 RepID=UPI0037443C82